MKTLLRLYITATILLAGCGVQGPVVQTPTLALETVPVPTPSETASFSEPTAPAKPSTPIPSPTSTQTSTPTPQPDPVSNIRYQLEAEFDIGNHHLAAHQTIIFRNSQIEPLSEIVLVIEANRWTRCFSLSKLSLEGKVTTPGHILEKTLLTIPLNEPLLQGDTATVLIDYELNLPMIPSPEQTDRPKPFGYTANQTNLVDWYPVVPPYKEGQGWLVYEEAGFGEHQVFEIADFQIDLELVGTGGNPVLAASAPGEQTGKSYHYELLRARSFAISASLYYKVFSQEVAGVTLLSYTFPINLTAGERALQDSVSAFSIYSQLFGPYPHKTLSVVEADFFDGMEYDGLFFLSRGFYNLYDGTPKGYLTIINVHETAHQWWYGLVGNDQALEPWLDEALCTYSELIFYELAYPELVSWWWEYRIDYYNPQGQVNGSIYDYPGYTAYRNAVYLRGAKFIHALRAEIGSDAFFSFLADYAKTYPFALATAEDFFTTLSEHSRIDYETVLQEYFLPSQ